MDYYNSFKPFSIKGLELDSRIIFPAISTKMATKDGFVSNNLIDYHIARVKGGSSLNIVEATSVHGPSAPKNFLRITDDEYVEDLRHMVEEVHKAGGRIGIQLWQSGYYELDEDREIISPSEFTRPDGSLVEEANIGKIKEAVKSFGDGARRASEAGFDLIEIHVGHNDSLHSFLSQEYNKREDKYGGSLKKRARFLLEIIERIKKNMREEMVLSMKIISQDDYLLEGLSPEDIIEVIGLCQEKGVDLVSISRGNNLTEAIKYEVPLMGMDMDFNMENLRKIREAIDLPIIYGGGINTPAKCEELLENDLCDLVAIARGQLTDPAFVAKMKDRELGDIKLCIQCNQGCYDGFFDKFSKNITCVRNPFIGKEREVLENKQAELRQKVAVIGGGIGGIESSIFLKERGHEPILFEKNSRLGGQMLASINAPEVSKLKPLLDRRIKELEELEVEIRLNTEFSDHMVVDEDFDSVIIATGAEPKPLDIKGREGDHVYDYLEVLSGQSKLEGKVGLIGSNSLAYVVVDYLLSLEEDLDLTILDNKELFKDLGRIKKVVFKEILEKNKIESKGQLEFLEIKKDILIYKEANKKKEEKFDYIIMASDSQSNKSNDIKQYCQDREIPFYVLGDALIPRHILDAISEAANIAIFEIK